MNYIIRQGRRIEVETIETCVAPKNTFWGVALFNSR